MLGIKCNNWYGEICFMKDDPKPDFGFQEIFNTTDMIQHYRNNKENEIDKEKEDDGDSYAKEPPKKKARIARVSL